MPQAGSRLPRTTAGRVGVDAEQVSGWIDALAPFDPHSLMVLRNGQVFAESWWAPYSPDVPQLLYSLSKSFTSTALGFAIGEGWIGLDDRVRDHLPARYVDLTVPELADLRIRHIASMASGHDHELLAAGVDPVVSLLTTAPEHEPGSFFAYSQPTTYTLAMILQRHYGATLTEILTRRLFEPLGIEGAWWQQHPHGTDLGFSGLHLRTEDIAGFGQFVLDGGRWQGERLLPPEWFDEASRIQVANGGDGVSPDWAQGYGLQFWRSRHGFRGDGAFGQFCLVVPEQDMVVAITSATTDMQGLLDTVWDRLLPAARSDGPLGDQPNAADRRLAESLVQREIPTVAVSPVASPIEVTLDSQVAGTDRLTMTPSSLRVEEGELALTDEGWAADRWPGTATPVWSRGGLRDDGTVWAELVLATSPHRLQLRQSTPGSTATLRWHTVPLGVPHPAALAPGLSSRLNDTSRSS